MTLWVRLSLAMTALAVVPVAVVTGWAVQVVTVGAKETSQAEMRREAGLHAAMVSLWMEDQARLVLAWPQLLGGDRLLTLAPEVQARFPVAVYRGMPTAATVLLADGDGVVVGSPVFATVAGERAVGSGQRAQQLVERLPLAAAVARPDVVHLGDAWFPDGPTTAPSIPLAVLAAGAPEGMDARVLGVEVVIDLADDIVAAATPTHAVAVLDRNGIPLIGGEQPLIRPDRLRSLLGTDRIVDFQVDGGDVWGTIHPIPSTPGWSLVVAEPSSVVLASAHEIRSSVLLFLLGATLLAVLVALLVAGSLSRPVELLRDAALAVAEGRFGQSPPIRRSDEIGELARAFSHMSARLRDNRDEIATQQREIEAFNRELQERVLDRTRALEEAQEELVRSGQLAAVAELGAGLAHELNNPLASVLGLAQLLRARDPSDPELADLEREASRCRDVVATLQRVQSSEPKWHDLPVVSVASVLAEVVELVSGAFRQRGVTLSVSGELPGQVRVDPAQAARVVAQVLNALRSGLDSGTRVSVSSTDHHGRVTLCLVADREVATNPDRRDDWMASGHGLWVAHQLLDRMGGRLEDDGRVWRISFPSA